MFVRANILIKNIITRSCFVDISCLEIFAYNYKHPQRDFINCEFQFLYIPIIPKIHKIVSIICH